ncbi:MAG: hypothetical protein ABI999_16320, partial [Acidobacteriota bacterium]
IDSKIKILTDHGDKMRFRVSDPVSGQKRRLSLQDLEHRDAGGDPDQRASSERQIRTILFKMLGKEEVLKEQMQSDSGKAIREADRVRTVYRHSSRKLPVPSFTKEEIDKLQEYCIEAADIRRFSYLEGVRSDLERTGKIEPRSKDDLHRLAARKTISDLTINRIGRERDELNNRRYYRFVDIGDRRVSLAQLDREGQAPGSPVWSFLEKLKSTALRLSGKGQSSTIKTESDRPRSDILRKLDEELTAIEKDLKAEKNKAKFIGKILTVDPKCASAEPVYSIEQLAEIDALSLRLKLKPSYEKNWVEQRTLIESATSDSPAARRLLKANPRSNLSEHKTETIAGRALALEIVAKVELEKAKEDLKTFTKSRRFYKFGIADKKSVSVEFVSLHDVELPSRSSLLDRALNEVFDSREHRSLRRTVSSLVRAREQRLSDDVAAAKDILVSATRNSSEFKQFSLFGLRSESTYHPIFTFSEIRLLEIRATNTPDPKEAARLRTVLDSASDKPVHSLKDILRDFENPEIISAREREHPSVIQEGTSPQRSTAFDDTRRDPKEIRVQSNQDHSR